MDKKKIDARIRLASKTGELVLNFQNLKSIPPEFAKLDRIHALRVRGNALSALPDWAAKWTGLREIDVGENPDMASLPKWAGELRQLRHLSIEGTKIRKLPPALAKVAAATARLLDAARTAMEAPIEVDEHPARSRPSAPCPWKKHGQIAAANATLDVLFAPVDVATTWEGGASHDRACVVKSRAGQGIADVFATLGGGVATLEPTWEDISGEAKSVDDAAARVDQALRGGGKDCGGSPRARADRGRFGFSRSERRSEKHRAREAEEGQSDRVGRVGRRCVERRHPSRSAGHIRGARTRYEGGGDRGRRVTCVRVSCPEYPGKKRRFVPSHAAFDP
jgi:hypothetical protein